MWVLPAMKHIREIFILYAEGSNKNPSVVYRHNVITRMQDERQLIVKVCDSLQSYMERVRAHVKGEFYMTAYERNILIFFLLEHRERSGGSCVVEVRREI